jgi:hypothetical protein
VSVCGVKTTLISTGKTARISTHTLAEGSHVTFSLGHTSATPVWAYIVIIVLTLSVVTYLAASNYLISYLRRVYTKTWTELGSFTLRGVRQLRFYDLVGHLEWYVAGMRTLGFVLFSSQYKAVKDRKLTFLIWLVRASFALSLLLFLVLFSSAKRP